MLPAEQREVVLMRYFGGLSFKEIAEQTDVSINTALGRMRYALINLRRMIREKIWCSRSRRHNISRRGAVIPVNAQTQ